MASCDREFFNLQLAFAKRVSALSGMPLPRALFTYTNFYLRFGLGWGLDLDPEQPLWREYLAGLQEGEDPCRWTYDFYLAQSSHPVVPPPAADSFGCFSYERLENGSIHLHFQNAETEEHAPLGLERLGRRLAELTELFGHVKQTQGHPLQVVGESWLYNVKAYRRLFPDSYVATAQPLYGRFHHFSLWGQFLDKNGNTKPDAAAEFLGRIEHIASLDELDQCFRLPLLKVEAPVQEFYDFYGVE
jgi:hypothetical protein